MATEKYDFVRKNGREAIYQSSRNSSGLGISYRTTGDTMAGGEEISVRELNSREIRNYRKQE